MDKLTVFAVVLLACTNSAWGEDAPQLFTDEKPIPNKDKERLVDPKIFSRGVLATLNVPAIQQVKARTPFRVKIFDRKEETLIIVPFPIPSKDSKAWSGLNKQGSELTLVLRQPDPQKERVIPAGTLETGDGKLFQIRHLDGTRVVVLEVDQTKLKREPDSIVPKKQLQPVQTNNSATSKKPITVTLAVFYTKKAEAAAGSYDIETVITTEWTKTRMAFQKSEVYVDLQLVWKARIEEDEAGTMEQILQRLRDGTGPFHQVHADRTREKADLVMLVCEKADDPGIAFRMETESLGFATEAFSLVSYTFLSGRYTFAHELAHNFGCCHDKDHMEAPRVFPFAQGYKFKVGVTTNRTILAIPALTTRRGHFSNPDVEYMGEDTGDAHAKNAKTINETADTVSMFE